jgi:hypothetical protein
MTVVFLTSRTQLAIADEDVAKLVARLERSSMIREAIDKRDERGVRLTVPEKQELLGVLEAWGFEPRGIADMGDLADLRIEMMRDLGVPPFDE